VLAQKGIVQMLVIIAGTPKVLSNTKRCSMVKLAIDQ
jgi:hypothetical protein